MTDLHELECALEAVLFAAGDSVSESKLCAVLQVDRVEVLAIVAYKQPVTRAYIEQIRGVDSAYTVGSLTDKGLIEECGRLDVPGRPILYRTTESFLRSFGLSSVSQLPALESFGTEDSGQLTLSDLEQTGSEETPPSESEA